MKCHVEVLLNMILFSSTIWTFANTEVFTALVDLEPLLRTEEEIFKTLERYLEFEEKRLRSLRWFRDEYEKLHKAAMVDVDTFLSNPVNAYLLVKRLTKDWQIAIHLIEGSMSMAAIANMTQKELIFPDDEDLTGAASALMRLQDTYLLDTTKLASGEIAGTPPSPELTAGDCFELGQQAYTKNDYYHTMLWMQEALDRLEAEEIKTMSKAAILEHMAHATFILGNKRHAVKLTEDILAVEPNHLQAIKNLQYYEDQVRIAEDSGEGAAGTDIESNGPVLPNHPYSSFPAYEKLCRGEQIRNHSEESRLYCHYTTNNSPYLLLQPAKEEILSFSPWIVMYHDVIRDKDMSLFKGLAHPKLARATVQNPHSGELENAPYRVSKSAWLGDDSHPRVAHASFMIEEITGLGTESAEFLHLINYGIGGHYEPHYDYRMPGDVDGFAYRSGGNRIATWIYYLSDVDAGGSTVFPDIGVQIKPEKGSAGFWYNLKRSGAGDLGTMHAGCPVLAGSKWVANKWLHEMEQEFRRPCSLNPLE